MSKKIDISGKRFGKLTVLNESKGSKWKCKCDCGQEKFIESYSLRNGISKSCGLCTKGNQVEKISENTMKIYSNTNKKDFTLIDAEDYSFLKNYTWYKLNNGYWSANLKNSTNKTIRLHQLIMTKYDKNYTPSRRIVPDHINRNKSDNRKSNLRLVSESTNMKNKGKLERKLFNKERADGGEKYISYSEKKEKYCIDVRIKGYRKTTSALTLKEAIEKRDKIIKEIMEVI